MEKLPEECEEAFDFTANDRKRCCKVPEKYNLEEREEKRQPKIIEGGCHKDEAEIGRDTPSLQKTKKRGRVHQKKREMHSLEKGGCEPREAGENKRKERKRKITEPKTLLVEVKPVHTTVIASFLNLKEEDLPILPSVSGHLTLAGAHFKPLPTLTKPPVDPQKPAPAPVDVLSLPCSPVQVDPPKLLVVPPCPDEVVSRQHSSSQMLPLVVHPRPTPAPDEMFSTRRSSSQVRHPRRRSPSTTRAADEIVAQQRPPSRKPRPFTSSPFELPLQLMLIDIEDEENEYVEYTGKTFQAIDLIKSERPQMPEAEMKPRKMAEVQDEVWPSEVVEVQEFEKEEGDPNEMGDTEAIEGHSNDASQTNELMMKDFCVASPDGPKNETQPNVNAQKMCNRKVPLFLFTWIEKARKRKEKKVIKEKERREKQLLPKLKHLWTNKHNRYYNS